MAVNFPIISAGGRELTSFRVSNLGFVQRYLWTNAGFGCLHKIPSLKNYHMRFDPTVKSLSPNSILSSYRLDLQGFPKQPENLLRRYYSIADYHSLYLSGELSPLAVAEYLIPSISRNIKPSNDHAVAFIECLTQRILDSARASTARYNAGNPLGLLDGIPTAIKDETEVAGYRTTHGHRRNNNIQPVAIASSKPVHLLEQVGAMIMGKLNMHELGTDTSNNNPIWGTPRNPHNNQYYTGGSSGGCAYVVAAGLVPFAIGADGGGSIRIPSCSS